MSKKIIIITGVIILFLALASLLAYIYLPIGEINPQTGERTTLQDYFPVGDTGDDGTVSTTTTDTSSDRRAGTSTSDSNTSSSVERLREVSGERIAGYRVYQPNGTSTDGAAVYYNLQGTGDIRHASLATTGTDGVVDDLDDDIYATHWFANGDGFITQSTINQRAASQIFSLTPSVPTDGSVDATGDNAYAPPIIDLAVSPGGNRFVTVQPAGNSGGRVTVHDASTNSQRVLFEHPLTQWRVAWPTTDTITVTSAAGEGENGVMYTVNTKTGASERILSGAGLTGAMNPTGDWVLYSRLTADQFELHRKNLSNGETERLGTPTLPEKCVWSTLNTEIAYCAVPTARADAAYPDAWYQGRVTFSDDIWRINVAEGEAEKMADITQNHDEQIDAVSLQLSPQEDYLMFIDRSDRSLWSLRLTEETETPEEDGGGGSLF